jgi:hypothetical protein
MRFDLLRTVSALFSIASGVVLVITIALGVATGGAGPMGIDFGDPAVLAQLAARGGTQHLIEGMALTAPALALGAGLGWLMLAGDRAIGRLGIVLWYAGMIFVLVQDGIELALVQVLPSAYADNPGATVIVGTAGSAIIGILTMLGDGISNVGAIILALAILQGSGRYRVAALILLASSSLLLIGVMLPALSVLRLPGFVLFLVWLFAAGIELLRGAAESGQRVSTG